MLVTTPESPLLGALLRHYEQLIDHVRRYVGRPGGDGSVAREVVHEVCIELIEAPPAQPVHTPLAFLRQVTKRRAIDRYRADACYQAVISPDIDAALLDVQAGHPDVSRLVAARQQLQLLVQAIEALPPRCRDVFVLHKIHELTQPQVATHLGISLKTVEKHLRLGLASCRGVLGDLA